MKVFSIAGYHHTGKTTLVVKLITELKNRGYKVQTIKDIHSKKFTMETENSNSWKHWKASNDAVIARGLHGTYQIWHERLSLSQMLQHLDADFVIVEGMKTASLPRVLCATNTEQLDELFDDTVFAISGKFQNESYKNIKNHQDIEKLTDLIEEKVFEVLPFSKNEKCGICGLDCKTMVGKIIKGEKKRSDCKNIFSPKIKIKFNDKQIDLAPFIQNTFLDIIEAYSKNLKGYKVGDKIEITIERHK